MDNNINLLTSTNVLKKPTKKTNNIYKIKKTNKPVKVVYISNPMKIKTSASRFRALVQELTGQDAEYPDPTKFAATHGGADDGQDQGGFDSMVPKIGEDHHHYHQYSQYHDGFINNSQEQPAESNNSSSTTITNNSRYEGLDDDVLMPEMMESFEAAMFPSISTTSPWYDSLNNNHRQIMM